MGNVWSFRQRIDKENYHEQTHTTVLDGLKAYLEHNIKLNLIGDKYPKEVSNHGQ